jgi:hypothetical protein
MGVLSFITGTAGRIVRLAFSIVGLVLIVVGLILSLTIVGIIIGLPLILMGIIFVAIGRWMAYKAYIVGAKAEEHIPGKARDRRKKADAVAKRKEAVKDKKALTVVDAEYEDLK